MQTGDILDGKYRVDRLLGEGGMGIVFAVTHLKLGKKYAIKVIKSSALAIPGVADRFLREARAASELRSEHVGAVSDVGELPTGEPYMVMEILEGQDLGHVLERASLPTDVAVDYILQTCEALAEAHALGMVHRDIKPANLFVVELRDGSRLVKVLDFGIATAPRGEISGLTQTNSVMGSPQYMSPEQLRSSKVVDARSDIWSLGVTLYELVSGRQPFEGTSFTELAIKIATESHTPLTGVPTRLAWVVDRCLRKDAARRYADVTELGIALAPLTHNGAKLAADIARTFRHATPPTPRFADGDAIARSDIDWSAALLPPGADYLPTAPDRPPVRQDTTLGGSAASFSRSSRKPRSKTRMFLLGGVAAVALGGAAGFVMLRNANRATSHEAAQRPDSPPAPAPARSHVRLATVPPDAELRIDGAVVENPHDRSYLRTDAPHRIEVTAAGHQPRSESIKFDQDRDLVLTLNSVPEPTVAAKPRAATAPKSQPTRVRKPAPARSISAKQPKPEPKQPERKSDDEWILKVEEK